MFRPSFSEIHDIEMKIKEDKTAPKISAFFNESLPEILIQVN